MKYRVPLKLTFDGFAIVEAVDEEDAEYIACYHMGANLGHVSDGACNKITDHEFDIHANVERRDNESIEEFYSTIEELLEDKGFNIEFTGAEYLLQRYTPEGEDWNLSFYELRDIVEYAENFDPKEEFKVWFGANRGEPDVGELWKDQLWKQELLTEIADQIEELGL